MAMALRRSRSCASMKARWGSQAEPWRTPRHSAAGAGGRGGGIWLAPGAGGHPGGICLPRQREALLVTADRLAIDPRDALDLALAGAGLQQGRDGCLQMRLQDVHSLFPLDIEGMKVTSCQPDAPGRRRRRFQRLITPFRVGEFEVAIGGGVWPANGAHAALERGKGPDQELPVNRGAGAGDEEGILHNLDRAVINYLHGRRIADGKAPYDTVRGFFHQGKPVFASSAIGQLSHVQIAVRNATCILGYFHPQSPIADPFQGLDRLPNPPYRKKKTAAPKS